MLYSLYLSIYLMLLAIIGAFAVFMLWRYEHSEPITKMEPIESHIYLFKTSFEEGAKTLEKKLNNLRYYRIDRGNYVEYIKKESRYYLVTADKFSYIYTICKDTKHVTLHIMY